MDDRSEASPVPQVYFAPRLGHVTIQERLGGGLVIVRHTEVAATTTVTLDELQPGY